jgi:hypothetical protein
MNPWIEHLKQYASKKNITYAQAIKDPKARASYKPKTAKASKGGAVYGDRDSDDEEKFTMGKPPPTATSSRPRKFIKGVKPERPFSMGKEPAKTTRRVAPRVSAPPSGYKSPVPVLKKFMFPARLAKKPTDMSLKELKFRMDSIIDAIEKFQTDGHLTEIYGNTLIGDVEAVMDRADLSVSRKHDVLTNIVKEVRTAVDQLVSGRDAPDPQAF